MNPCKTCNGTRKVRTPRKGYVLQESCPACAPERMPELTWRQPRASRHPLDGLGTFSNVSASPFSNLFSEVDYARHVVRRIHGAEIARQALRPLHPQDTTPEGPRPSG